MYLKVFILFAIGLVPGPSSPLSAANIVDTNVEQAVFSYPSPQECALSGTKGGGETCTKSSECCSGCCFSDMYMCTTPFGYGTTGCMLG